MAGTLKVNAVQLGDSVTASQNFVWQTNADGTAKLSRGNVGATTQDILTVDANGKVLFPQSKGPAFSAYPATTQSIPNAVATKVQLNGEDFDTAGAFDSTTNFRFQPTVAGYYQFSGSFSTASVTTIIAFLYKNGAEYRRGNQNNGVTNSSQVSALIYLNGSTDYVELWGYQAFGSAQNTNGSNVNYLTGFLAREA